LVPVNGHFGDRYEVSAEAEALMSELVTRLGDQATVVFHPGELRESLYSRLGGRDVPTPQAVGQWLRRLGFRGDGRDRGGARYVVTAEQLREVTNRYIPDRNVTSSSSHPNDPVSLSG